MAERTWYYAYADKEQGPVSEASLAGLIADGTIGRTSLVWTEGMTDWQEAATALPAAIRPAEWSGPAAPPPPQPPARPVGMDGPRRDTSGASSAHPETFPDAVKACFQRFATFEGRARRPEYWWFFLFTLLVNIGIGIVLNSAEADLVGGIVWLVLLLPSLAVGARRLHDIGRSGWWQLVGIIPLIGWIILLVWFVSRGDEGENAYGPA